MKPGARPPPFDFSRASDDEPREEIDVGVVQVIEPPQTFGAPPQPVREPAGWPIYLAAAAVSVLWAGAPIAYAVGYRRGVSPLEYDPFALGVFALLAIGPVALVWLAAYALRQGMKLAAEVRRSRETASQMLAPAGLAAAEAGTVIEAIRLQIDETAAAARAAQSIMTSMREQLARETERLNEAAALSGRTANDIAGQLGAERGRLNDLAEGLGAQAAAIRGASDHAAEVTAAAGQATDAARTAGEDLARHVARLETAGAGVGEQMRSVEEELARQRAALLELAERLRSDQQALAVETDARTARLSDLVVQSRAAAAEVGEAAQLGAEAIQHLTAGAAAQFTSLNEAAARERDNLAAALQASIDRVAAAAEEARRAAEAHAEAAQARVDLLNEAAFEAGRKADAVFESRLTQAKGLIEESAQIVDQAGGKANERLEASLASARATIADLEKLLSDIAARAEALPAEAERRAEELRVSMEQNLGDLVASAKRASEETKALDASFQQRVRSNYEMLSEAVRLMGLVAGDAAPPILAPVEPAPVEPAPAAEPPPAPKPATSLRGRLKLTPVASDQEFDAALASAAAKAAPQPEAETAKGLGWKGLLKSLDRDVADPEQLSERIVAEVKAMGVDPAAVLPSGKVDEIAVAVQTGDAEGARQVVRKVAGQATDKLARRLFADAALRGQADRYRRRFSGMLKDAAERDQQGFMVGSLLASDEGRAYLLLDAASNRT